MNKFLITLAVSFFFVQGLTAEVRKIKFEHGLIKYIEYRSDKAHLLSKYQIFLGSMGNNTSYLYNSHGKLLKSWKVGGHRVKIIPNCQFLSVSRVFDEHPKDKFISISDWSGNLVFKKAFSTKTHHDASLTRDGNILYIRQDPIEDQKQAILNYLYNTNKKKKFISLISKYKNLGIVADSIGKVDLKGNMLWELRLKDFFSFPFCNQESCAQNMFHYVLKGKQEHADWTHTNNITEIPENKWYEQGHQAFRPGNVLITVRNFSTIYIIDPRKKEIVWEYKGDYRGGLEGTHHAYMIPEGYPGAGNLLIFDNGSSGLGYNHHPEESVVLEVNPVSKKVLKVFDQGKTLYTNFGGVAERLKNGNTFVSYDSSGLALELDPEMNEIWRMKTKKATHWPQKIDVSHCLQ